VLKQAADFFTASDPLRDEREKDCHCEQ